MDKLEFRGVVSVVKPRIRLLRSFDQISHAYLGYTLVLDAEVEGNEWIDLRVAVGQKTHEKYRFRSGDLISGEALPLEQAQREWADLYKVSKLNVKPGKIYQSREDIDESVASPLAVYRERGHVRLDPKTYEAKCKQCTWGVIMATEITIDQWDSQRKKWRYESHCYGPRNCANYKPGKPRTVPGRKPGMVWVDDDVEREES